MFLLHDLGSELNLGGKNMLRFKGIDFARKLELKPPELSRRLKVLVKFDAIRKIKNGYMVNPDLIWVGKMSERPQALAIWNKER